MDERFTCFSLGLSAVSKFIVIDTLMPHVESVKRYISIFLKT